MYLNVFQLPQMIFLSLNHRRRKEFLTSDFEVVILSSFVLKIQKVYQFFLYYEAMYSYYNPIVHCLEIFPYFHLHMGKEDNNKMYSPLIYRGMDMPNMLYLLFFPFIRKIVHIKNRLLERPSN